MLSFFFLLPWNFTTKKRWCLRGECPHKTPPNAVKYGVWNLCSTTISLSRIKIRATVIFSNTYIIIDFAYLLLLFHEIPSKSEQQWSSQMGSRLKSKSDLGLTNGSLQMKGKIEIRSGFGGKLRGEKESPGTYITNKIPPLLLTWPWPLFSQRPALVLPRPTARTTLFLQFQTPTKYPLLIFTHHRSQFQKA